MASLASNASLGIFSFLLVIVVLTLELLILRYLMRLEQIGCECAMDWRRDYIMFFIALTIVNAFVVLFMGPQQLPGLQFALFIMGIMNVVFVLQYVHRLKKEKCECSISVYREIMYVIAILRAALYGLLLMLSIVFLFSFLNYQRSVGTTPSIMKEMNVRPIKPIKK